MKVELANRIYISHKSQSLQNNLYCFPLLQEQHIITAEHFKNRKRKSLTFWCISLRALFFFLRKCDYRVHVISLNYTWCSSLRVSRRSSISLWVCLIAAWFTWRLSVLRRKEAPAPRPSGCWGHRPGCVGGQDWESCRECRIGPRPAGKRSNSSTPQASEHRESLTSGEFAHCSVEDNLSSNSLQFPCKLP